MNARPNVLSLRHADLLAHVGGLEQMGINPAALSPLRIELARLEAEIAAAGAAPQVADEAQATPAPRVSFWRERISHKLCQLEALHMMMACADVGLLGSSVCTDVQSLALDLVAELRTEFDEVLNGEEGGAA